MKVLVNKCPYTGKIFEDDKKYANHLRALRYERHREMKEKRARDEFYDWLAEEKEKIVDPDMIGPWVLANQKKLMIASNAFKMQLWDRDRYYPDTDEFTKFEINVKWNSNVSNSHSCPKGGVENWCNRDKSLPSGYPGWQGRIGGTLSRSKKHMSSYPYSNICKLLDLHTGSGGGGNESWGYDVKIFAADWPVLAQARTFEVLAGK